MASSPQAKSRIPRLSSPISLPNLHDPIPNRSITMRSRSSSTESRDYDEHLRSSVPKIFAASRALQSILGMDRRAAVPFSQPPPLPESVERLMEQWRVTESQTLQYGKSVGPRVSAEDWIGCVGGRDGKEMSSRLGSRDSRAQDDSDTETEFESQDKEASDEDSNSDAEPQHSELKTDEGEETVTLAPCRPQASPSSRHKLQNTPRLTNANDSFVTVPTIVVSSPPKERRTQARIPTQPHQKRPRTSSFSAQNLPKPPAAKKRRSLPWTTSFNARNGPLSFSQNLTQTLLSWFQFDTQAQIQKHMTEHPEHIDMPYWTKPSRNISLICASFWTLETNPPRELLRIEPGDVEVMRWCEVDTFSDRKAEKGVLGKLFNQGPERRRACHEGRWMFLIVREHFPSSPYSSPSVAQLKSFKRSVDDVGGEDNAGEGVRPYHTLAFPAPCITRSLTDDIYVSSHTSTASEYLNPELLHPNYAPDMAGSQPQPIPLRRTILYFEKAGNLPLIESYGADAGIWTDWIETVGKGYGRIMVWSEAGSEVVEGHGGEKKVTVPPQWLETLVEKDEEETE